MDLLVIARSCISSSALDALRMSSTMFISGYSRPMTGVVSSYLKFLPSTPDLVCGEGYVCDSVTAMMGYEQNNRIQKMQNGMHETGYQTSFSWETSRLIYHPANYCCEIFVMGGRGGGGSRNCPTEHATAIARLLLSESDHIHATTASQTSRHRVVACSRGEVFCSSTW